MTRDGGRAQFDQQPIEAQAFVQACLAAARITGDDTWAVHVWRCFQWFHGHNDLGVALYHEDTGGSQDGLRAGGANRNQGAESTLAYLLSVLDLHLYCEVEPHDLKVAGPAQLGYAVIGAGGFAAFCLQNFRELDCIRPVAVWNRTASKAKQFALSHDVQMYDQLDELLCDPHVHVVHIARHRPRTPS